MFSPAKLISFTIFLFTFLYVVVIEFFINSLSCLFLLKFGLNLIIECNKTTDDYLDITLNSLDGTCKLYQKPGNTLQQIHKESSHPPYIIEQSPITIERRLSNHSSNKTVFRHAAEDYEKTLKKSGYNVTLQ